MRMKNSEKIRKALEITLEEVAEKMGYKKVTIDTSNYIGIRSNGVCEYIEADELMDILGSML